MSDLKDYMRRRMEAEFRLADTASKVMKTLAGPDDSYPLVLSQEVVDELVERAKRGDVPTIPPFAVYPPLPRPWMRPATPRERAILARHWREIC